MARKTQIMGMTGQAMDFLKENAAGIEFHEDAQDYGICNDGPNLMKYPLKDGRTAYEYIQGCPWTSSGPMIFIDLRIDEQTPFSWSLMEEHAA